MLLCLLQPMRMTTRRNAFLVSVLCSLLFLLLLQSSLNAQVTTPAQSDLYFATPPLLIPSEDQNGFPTLQAIVVVSSALEMTTEVQISLKAENTSFVYLSLANMITTFQKGSNLLLFNISYSDLLSLYSQNSTTISVRFTVGNNAYYTYSDYSNVIDLRDLLIDKPNVSITSHTTTFIQNGLGSTQFVNISATLYSSSPVSVGIIPILAFEHSTLPLLFDRFYFYSGGSGAFLPLTETIDFLEPNQTVSFLLNLDFVLESLSRIKSSIINESNYNVSLYLGYTVSYIFQSEMPYFLGLWSTDLYPRLSYSKIESWNLSEIKERLNNSLSAMLDVNFGTPGILLYDDNETGSTFAFANITLSSKSPLLLNLYTQFSYWVENSKVSETEIMEKVYVPSNNTVEMLIPLNFQSGVPKVYNVSIDLWIYYSNLLTKYLFIPSSEPALNDSTVSVHLNKSIPILYATESFGELSEFQATLEPMSESGFNISNTWLYSYYQQETEVLEFQVNVTRPGLVYLEADRQWGNKPYGPTLSFPILEYRSVFLFPGIKTIQIPYSIDVAIPSMMLSRMPGTQKMIVSQFRYESFSTSRNLISKMNYGNQTITPPKNPLLSKNLNVTSLNASYALTDDGRGILSVDLKVQNFLNVPILSVLRPLILSPLLQFNDFSRTSILSAFSTFAEPRMLSFLPGINDIHIDFPTGWFSSSTNLENRFRFIVGLELFTNLGNMFLSLINNSIFDTSSVGIVSLVNNDNDRSIEGIRISLSMPLQVNPLYFGFNGIILGDFLFSVFDGFGLKELSQIILPTTFVTYTDAKIAEDVSYVVNTFSSWNSYEFIQNPMIVSVLDFTNLDFTWNKDTLFNIGDTDPYPQPNSGGNTNQSGVKLEPPRVNKLQVSSYIDVSFPFIISPFVFAILVLFVKRRKAGF